MTARNTHRSDGWPNQPMLRGTQCLQGVKCSRAPMAWPTRAPKNKKARRAPLDPRGTPVVRRTMPAANTDDAVCAGFKDDWIVHRAAGRSTPVWWWPFAGKQGCNTVYILSSVVFIACRQRLFTVHHRHRRVSVDSTETCRSGKAHSCSAQTAPHASRRRLLALWRR